MIWEFVGDQILGMKWLKDLLGNLLSLVGLDIDGRVGGSIHFFIYDVIKIVVLQSLLLLLTSLLISIL